MSLLVTAGGAPVPPSDFSKRLERFDPNLRVVWGWGLAAPFPGWVIERRIPPHMKAKVYATKGKKAPNRERYSHQVIVDTKGVRVADRQFDMMPDWHPIYRVMDENGQPILNLGEFVLDYLRANYERTLLGIPELGRRHHAEDIAEREARETKANDNFLDRVAETVMDHKHEVFADVTAFTGQPAKVMEGTELQ